MKPIIKSGLFHAGADLQCGENVVIEVAEQVVVGDRCVLPDNAYFGGRRIEIADDFFGYAHWNKRLEIGLGRRDDEHAILSVGNRATFHDNRIDLAREVTIGNDVGLSPEVAIYTHGYWMSPLEGYPCARAPVEIHDGVIVGFRSTILPGAIIADSCVIGAHSLVVGPTGVPGCPAVYGGVPANKIKDIKPRTEDEINGWLHGLRVAYIDSTHYRKLNSWLDTIGIANTWTYPEITFRGCVFNFQNLTVSGEEDEYTDDFRDFMFKRGIRFYTKRPFRKLPQR